MSVAVVYRNGVFVPIEKVDLPEESPAIVVAIGRPGAGKSAWERHAFGRKAVMAPDFKDPIPEMEDPPDCCFDEDSKA